jgi:hypothetical protein
MHLTSLGLIEFNGILSFDTAKPMREIAPSFFGRVRQLKSADGTERDLNLGHVTFTVVGIELHRISGASANTECATAALKNWKQSGWSEEGSAV